MDDKFISVKTFEPFEMPNNENIDLKNKFMMVTDACSVTLPVQVSTDGEYVVASGFKTLVDILEERGARRGEEYIICLNATPYGHFIIGINTFTNYLSQEDVI